MTDLPCPYLIELDVAWEMLESTGISCTREVCASAIGHSLTHRPRDRISHGPRSARSIAAGPPRASVSAFAPAMRPRLATFCLRPRDLVQPPLRRLGTAVLVVPVPPHVR